MTKKKKKQNAKKSGKSPDWREFEEAVARFLTAIGQGAKVSHDVLIPDAQTGLPRQRDVWVEWSVAGHYPTKALISCKHWNKPLDQGDIDHFRGEFLSTSAQVGIIYSLSGFNANAIEKAKVLGFHCCKLYRDQPADLPGALIIENVFHLRPACVVRMNGLEHNCRFTYWKEVFSLRVIETSVLDLLASKIDCFQKPTTDRECWRRVREGDEEVIIVEREGLPPLEIKLRCFYRIFRAKIEYTMLNGSYNITHGDFVGRQAFPIIDSRSTNPGPGWEALESFPEVTPNNFLAIFAIGDWLGDLTAFGETPLPSPIDALASGNSAAPVA